MANVDESVTSARIVSDVATNDGLENLIANMGTHIDKRANSKFVNSVRLSAKGNEAELDALYRTDWLAGKVVDIIPEDMTREWREFKGDDDLDPEVVRKLVEEEERLDLSGAFETADKWSRLYGTSLIVMSVDDGQTPDKPLRLDAIKPGSLRHIKVVDRNRFTNTEMVPIADPLSVNYGMPEFYRFNDTSVRIHHSRVIRFDGVKLPYDLFRENNYVSDSVLDRLYDALTNFVTVSNGSASMVYESNVDIIKVKSFMNQLSSPNGEAHLQKRFTMASMAKSFNNMLLLDSEEEYQSKSNNFAGLRDLLDAYGKFLAAASDIPATRLLGTSASGLNATGEGDLKNYYDMIRSKQKSKYKPKLDYFDEIMVRNLGLDPDADYSYEFKSLFQMTPKEQSEVDMNNSVRDTNYYNMGVVTEGAIAKELQQKGTYSNISDEDIEELEELGDFKNELISNPETSELGVEPQAPDGAQEAVKGDEDEQGG